MSPIKNVPLASAGREDFLVAVDNVELVTFSPCDGRVLTLRIMQSICVRSIEKRRVVLLGDFDACFFSSAGWRFNRSMPEDVCRSSYLTLSSFAGCCSRGQIFFNCSDQLGYADRFGERWASLDVKPLFCLRSRDQR